MPENWCLGIIPGLILLIIKIKAGNYFDQLQQKIQRNASQIDNYLEQRVNVLQNCARLLDKAIDLDKSTFENIAKYRSGNAGDSDAVRNELGGQVDTLSRNINIAVENYPDLKANENFHTVGEGIENAKIEKIRYQIVSSNNAIAALQDGTVHYITPQLTTENYEKLEALGSKGMVMLQSDQLGYGYIGVNSAKVNDINLRKAIMCAMNTGLALDYYRAGTAERIFWNMSRVSWAYPTGSAATDNGKDYPQMGTWNEDAAVENIKKYMQKAGYSGGESDLKITFTIAGSTLQDHPTYKVFRDAAALLNELGWEVEVVCDTQALTKINTGSLAVWAAAWSSALDPDMYQVYHKDSTATSTLAWGYNYLKTSGTAEEMAILNELSDLIDDARETNDKAVRADLYQDAMDGYVSNTGNGEYVLEYNIDDGNGNYIYRTVWIDSEAKHLPKLLKSPEVAMGYSDWDQFLANLKLVYMESSGTVIEKAHYAGLMEALRKDIQEGNISNPWEYVHDAPAVCYEYSDSDGFLNHRQIYIPKEAEHVQAWLKEHQVS